ncbi:MAG: alpha/beta fold hydrolase [Actinomycetales bacterium]
MGAVTWGKRAGALGAALGAVAATTAVGVVVERRTLERRRARRMLAQPGVLPDVPQGTVRTVRTDDGVELHVETVGDARAPFTVVFVHGYALTSASWVFQRAGLEGLGRQVYYDQRGHGQSGIGDRSRATIDQLGRDLARVIEATAPDGPLILVGHSMGGMTVMALADQRPELFGDRVIGVGLLSTSAGGLAEVTLGVPRLTSGAMHRLAPGIVSLLDRRSALVERARRMSSDLSLALTKRWSFASDVAPDVVELAAEMITSTPIGVVADFFPAFDSHDKVEALAALTRGVEVLVLVGEEDLLTPPLHSELIAQEVPNAELVKVPDAGHLVELEHPEVVNEALRGLIQRATRSVPRRLGELRLSRPRPRGRE